MILAGDIGGTKTNLAIFESLDKPPLLEQRFLNREQSDLSSMVKLFLGEENFSITAACFAVAGPVRNGRCAITNLPWVIDSQELQQDLGINQVALLNDLEATAYGVSTLKPDQFEVINVGIQDASGNAALIAAGTGLGEAIMFRIGEGYHISATEGGHTDFAPQNGVEVGLYRYLAKKYGGHVSYERVVSGPGLVDIFDYFSTTGNSQEHPEIIQRIKTADDPSAAIAELALAGESKSCVDALDLFVRAYGAEAGNLALKTLATGGIYVGGGIAPKLLTKMREGGFFHSFHDKGRFSKMLKDVPVKVILDDKMALRGAVYFLSSKSRSN